jgi:hypothetical protein
MSEILVVVPPEWTPVDLDTMSNLLGYTYQTWVDMQGRDMRELNDKLVELNWYADDRRLIDVMVINQKLYLKLAAGFYD